MLIIIAYSAISKSQHFFLFENQDALSIGDCSLYWYIFRSKNMKLTNEIIKFMNKKYCPHNSLT